MEGVFVGEGDLVVERALDAGYELHSILVDGARRKPIPSRIESTGTPIFAAAPNVLQHITGYHLHRGLLACFRRRPLLDPAEVLAHATTLIVLEGINNPTNLGVILRCGVALGVDAYVMDSTCSDPLYRRSGRVSMGEAYRLPYARLQSFPDDLDSIHNAGFTTLALTPGGEVDIGELSFEPAAEGGFGVGQRRSRIERGNDRGQHVGSAHPHERRCRQPQRRFGGLGRVLRHSTSQARQRPLSGSSVLNQRGCGGTEQH